MISLDILREYRYQRYRKAEWGSPTLVEGSRMHRLAAYREVRDTLQTRILNIFPQLEDGAF